MRGDFATAFDNSSGRSMLDLGMSKKKLKGGFNARRCELDDAYMYLITDDNGILNFFKSYEVEQDDDQQTIHAKMGRKISKIALTCRGDNARKKYF